MSALAFGNGFDWRSVTWSKRDGRIPPLCSYCMAHISDDTVPLIIWAPDGRMAQFCDGCTGKYLAATS